MYYLTKTGQYWTLYKIVPETTSSSHYINVMTSAYGNVNFKAFKAKHGKKYITEEEEGSPDKRCALNVERYKFLRQRLGSLEKQLYKMSGYRHEILIMLLCCCSINKTDTVLV